jgi:hypothetical protein
MSNYDVQLTTPIFGEKQLNDAIRLAEALEIKIRVTKLLPHGRAKDVPQIVLPPNKQIDIASKYLDDPNVVITDSLLQPKYCNYKNKFTLLPNGIIKSCVAGKHICDNKNKICNRL